MALRNYYPLVDGLWCLEMRWANEGDARNPCRHLDVPRQELSQECKTFIDTLIESCQEIPAPCFAHLQRHAAGHRDHISAQELVKARFDSAANLWPLWSSINLPTCRTSSVVGTDATIGHAMSISIRPSRGCTRTSKARTRCICTGSTPPETTWKRQRCSPRPRSREFAIRSCNGGPE